MRTLLALGELGGLSLQQAAETIDVSRSTAYRLLVTLESFDFVERIAGGGYRIGTGALRWARKVEQHQGVRGVADPILRELHEITGELAGLVLLSESGLTWVEGVEGPSDEPREVYFESRADRIVPVHASGSGRAIGAHLEPHRLGALLGPEPYHAYTANTPTTWRQLRPILDEARTRGYAVDREEVQQGVRGVASPIFAADRVVGAVSVAGSPVRLDEERIRDIAVSVRLAADKISNRLTSLRDLLALDGNGSGA